MDEGIKTEQDNYEPDLGPVELAADFSADPHTHALHHLMCLNDRERFDDELEQLREENVELLARLERVERAANMLASMVNWDKVIVYEEGF